jgi:hypothetical protein
VKTKEEEEEEVRGSHGEEVDTGVFCYPFLNGCFKSSMSRQEPIVNAGRYRRACQLSKS